MCLFLVLKQTLNEQNQMQILDVIITMDDQDVHKSRLLERGASKYLKNYESIWAIQTYLIKNTKSKILNNVNLYDSFQGVMVEM